MSLTSGPTMKAFMKINNFILLVVFSSFFQKNTLKVIEKMCGQFHACNLILMKLLI